MANKYTMTLDYEEQEYILLEPGEYPFTVTEIDYGDFNGSAKLPPCGKVIVSLTVTSELGDAYLKNNFYVCKEGAGMIAAFLKSIGVLKEGQKTFTPDWDSYVGKTGTVKIGHREYNGNTYNNVERFVPEKKKAAPASNKKKWGDTEW